MAAAKVKKKKPAKNRGGRSENGTPDWDAKLPLQTRKSSDVIQSTVSVSEIKEILSDTVWRVMNEINPDLERAKDAKLNSDEVGYVLSLFMYLGYGGENPRRGLTIKNHEYEGEVPECRACR